MSLRVMQVRKKLGLTREELARQLRVPAQTLYRVETGREIPWPSLRQKLADFYSLDPEVLFADIDAAQRFLRKQAGEVINDPEAA